MLSSRSKVPPQILIWSIMGQIELVCIVIYCHSQWTTLSYRCNKWNFLLRLKQNQLLTYNNKNILCKLLCYYYITWGWTDFVYLSHYMWIKNIWRPLYIIFVKKKFKICSRFFYIQWTLHCLNYVKCCQVICSSLHGTLLT